MADAASRMLILDGTRYRPRRKNSHSRMTMGIGTPMSHSRLPVSMSPSLQPAEQLGDRESVP
ncbi:hypothetical protein, partial [Methylobacterium sp. J-070]|uniref:hypothetical protein n=1 Tax=Methylobacterium sp. J-070 TaxID=2836650 RepID=UPI001FBB9562